MESTYTEAKKILESGDSKKGYHRAVLADGIVMEDLSEAQRTTYQLADQVAQAVQTKIRIYKGTNMAQGFYNHATDEIWLNLNAANRGREAIMAFTLSHELVHRAKKGSPAKYQAFVNFLMKEYGKQGSDVEAMIAEQIQAAEEFNKTVPKAQRVNMTWEKAFEEVVCDACQRMLLDTDAGQKLAEFGTQSKENKSFLEDLKRWITELLDKLRSYFRNAEPDSLAAKEFAKFDANVKKILADMYVDMSIDAGEKLSTIKAAAQNSQEEKSYSLPKVEAIKPSEEQVRQNIREVADMKSVYTVDASKLSDNGKTLAEIYREFFTAWGENIHSDVFGDIATKNSSIRSEVRHGSTVAKIASIEAIPSVIEVGKIVDWIEKNNGTLFRIVVAAPITIGKQSYIMGVMLQRDNQHQRLYLHDVIIEEEASGLSQDYLVSTGSSEKSENLFTTSILQKVLNVKRQNKLPIGENTSPRALLANALEGITTNDIEKQKIQEYKSNVERLDAEEQKLRELRAQIKELSFAKGKRDTEKIKSLQLAAAKTANRIETLDKMLLGLEAAKPLQNILKREKEKAYKRADQKRKEALESYRKQAEAQQKEITKHYQESRKKGIESREKWEAREILIHYAICIFVLRFYFYIVCAPAPPS